jgi:eukaryotic-like serine/threonine-protein kinase
VESPQTLLQARRTAGPGGSARSPTLARPHPRIVDGATEDVLLGRYRLLDRLGEGGFGVVWRAHDELLLREVAVKRIPRSRAGGDERASREALAAARLSHPAIVALFEACETEDAFYLISELVHGETLARLIARRALRDEDVFAVGRALASALAHAHARGVVHRDVKPGNVIVPHAFLDSPPASARTTAAKLTDFGGAWMSGAGALTRTGDVLGTLAYMAPEQADGGEVAEPADLYSLALVLYETLCGENPMRGATPAETVRRIGDRVPSLADPRPELPRTITRALDRALLPRPRDRGTLADLGEALALGGSFRGGEDDPSDRELVDPSPPSVALAAPAQPIAADLSDETRPVEMRARPRATWLTREPTDASPFGEPVAWTVADAAAPERELTRRRQPRSARATSVESARDARERDARDRAARELRHAREAPAVSAAARESLGLLDDAANDPRPLWRRRGRGHAPALPEEAQSPDEVAARTARLALPRALVFGALAAASVWLAASGRVGLGLLLLAASVPLLLLPRRASGTWLLGALAPVLGTAGLAGAFPAIAGQVRAWQTRAALGALGYWWLTLAEPLSSRSLWLGSPHALPPRGVWEASLSPAFHVLTPMLSLGTLLGAGVWAAAAAALPMLARGRSAVADTLGVTAWSLALVLAARSLDGPLPAGVAHASPRGALLGGVFGAAIALGARAMRGPVRAQ